MKKSLRKRNKLYYHLKLSKKNKKEKKNLLGNLNFIINDGKSISNIDINTPFIETTKKFWEDKIKEGLHEKWYKNAINKWTHKSASISGVLDGYESASEPDLIESSKFLDTLAKLFGKNTNKQMINTASNVRALDCGAGIGRITKGALIERFHFVDLVEPVPHFLNKAKIILSELEHQGNFYQYSLQNFNTTEKYDCIWIQWVLGQLTDSDVIMFLKRCKNMLKPNGIIVVKENMLLDGFSIDENYNLINRNYNDFKKIFYLSGLTILYEENQKDFPSYLTKVHMFALE